jgi:hypothetical protein
LKNQNGLCTLEGYGHMLPIIIKSTVGTKEDFWQKVIVAW